MILIMSNHRQILFFRLRLFHGADVAIIVAVIALVRLHVDAGTTIIIDGDGELQLLAAILCGKGNNTTLFIGQILQMIVLGGSTELNLGIHTNLPTRLHMRDVVATGVWQRAVQLVAIDDEIVVCNVVSSAAHRGNRVDVDLELLGTDTLLDHFLLLGLASSSLL